MTSRFLNIIDVDVFRFMLDGFFKDWPGTYDVLLTDTNEYLFNPIVGDHFQELCKTIRHEAPDGVDFCKNCDRKHADLAAENNEPLVYLCDAGLLDIAVPIKVDKELVATIFCGQRRSSNPEQEKQGEELANNAARKLGISPNKLLKLRNKAPILQDDEVKRIIEKLWIMANYLSNLGRDMDELNQQRHKLRVQLQMKNRIDQALSILGETADNENEFWRKVNLSLNELCEVIDAEGAALLMYEQKVGFPISYPLVKAAANFPRILQSRKYQDNDKDFEQIIISMKSEIYEMKTFALPGTFWWDIQQIQPTDCQVDRFACIPILLDAQYKGVIVFLINDAHDIKSGLLIRDELGLLTPVQERIATAYHNFQLIVDHQAQVKLRGEWLDNLSHQILAPITGIQGHADNLLRWLQPFLEPNRDIKSDRTNIDYKPVEISIKLETTTQRLIQIDHTLDAIISMTYSASQLARNFAWVGGIGDEKRTVHREIINNMVAFLIKMARNVQGMAKQRGLRRVHIDKDSIEKLNNRVAINRLLFSQVIGNLLDNAVKYSDRGTEVIVTGEVFDGQGIITITNRGIPISEEDVKNVFIREYRTQAARARYPIGTGIGLTIASDIIQLHGGMLSVTPSKTIQTPEYEGYETAFQIIVPLVNP